MSGTEAEIIGGHHHMVHRPLSIERGEYYPDLRCELESLSFSPMENYLLICDHLFQTVTCIRRSTEEPR